ncbi:two-component regulator propeller domain-containing protein [Pontibacter silvestris]|uniref:Two-component regulator propeller domain-containing protein n=1 Tax=Pontibacter silvestris TaxID=2305183 RepID=A0ABW4X3R9_9BACT|nr:two-component regulator propeller domain-containing protein [Pontibacter silvestris]MCC9137085.1 hypothetical protein [Pontibacter silvestris]
MQSKHSIWLRPYPNPLLFVAGLGILLCNVCSYGQGNLSLGSWQLHVPYQQGKAVADANELIYTATEQGLFYYDKEFNNTETITKIDGLREQQISSLGYDTSTGTLVIAYQSSSIDLLRGRKITNISGVYRQSISGEKVIHHTYIHNKIAYLACSFGVVVLDLSKQEVKDTYSNLGPNGEQLNVHATAILHDSIYIATDIGVLVANRVQANLKDFHSWHIINEGLPDGAVTGLAAFNERLYATASTEELYKLAAASWDNSNISASLSITSINTSADYLVLATSTGVTLLDKQSRVSSVQHVALQSPQDATVDVQGVIWVADAKQGLVRLNQAGADAAVFAPNGPYAGEAFRLYAANSKLYAFSGGYDESSYQNSGNTNGFYVYSQGEWESYNSQLYPNTNQLPYTEDVVDAAYSPVTKKLYIASYGSGLLAWAGLGKVTLYNGTNSTLSGTSASDKAESVRVSDVAVDTESNVWVVNRNQQYNAPEVHVLKPDETWQSFMLPGLSSNNFEQILIDDYDQKWLSVARTASSQAGIVVWNNKNNFVHNLTEGEGKGGLPSNAVYSMAKDLNGDVWIGTASGVGVFYNPGFIFESQANDAHIPIIDGRPLLNGQVVRSIAVDGANRKWIGTDNGLWLFGRDGDELIHHFTTQNSPLPSDKVLSVAVEHQSGEVFVATAAGIASYRGTATVTEGKAECAVVFPNPVRPNYSGLIGVSGLPNNAQVRITDISGTLVYSTQATGGTIAWDARDYNGKRVKAGVYLVLSADEAGEQSCVTKIAVLE